MSEALHKYRRGIQRLEMFLVQDLKTPMNSPRNVLRARWLELTFDDQYENLREARLGWEAKEAKAKA